MSTTDRTSRASTYPSAGRRRASAHAALRHSALALALAVLGLALAFLAPSALAKEPVDFFGGGSSTAGGQFGIGFDPTTGIAVNESGAGPADAGDIYVADSFDNRIQRFGRDENGTPSDTSDDTYFFISAWGADVDSFPSGGSDYEICTVAAQCKQAVASGGNGSAAGNGALSHPRGVAIDQDSGDVYVTDAGNNRVNVYAGDGAFLRSFGFDVVQSGPGQVSGPSEQQQLTVKASGGKFSLSFAGRATGPRGRGVISSSGGTTIREVVTSEGAFAVGQGISGQGIPPGTTITAINQFAQDTLTASQPLEATSSGGPPIFGDTFDPNISAEQLEAALNALPSIGGVGGSVTVTGGPGDSSGSTPYTISFGGSLAGEDVPSLVPTTGGLTNSGAASVTVTESVQGGAYEICSAAAGDVCKAGNAGGGKGQLSSSTEGNAEGAHAIAVSQPDGNPASGTVFLADAGNHRVDSFALDGSSPADFGSSVFSGVGFNLNHPTQVAVDSRGIVYASNIVTNPSNVNQIEFNGIERYDSENANGGGVGFLARIDQGVNERQKVTIAASAGQFRLSFEGDTTVDMPFNLRPRDAEGGVSTPGVIDSVEEALAALPSIGSNNNVDVFGGPGGSFPYTITFKNGLGAKDMPQIVASNGTTPLSGGAGASVETSTQGKSGVFTAGSPNGQATTGLAVDPDPDGAGPDTDVLYVEREGVIQQFGPANPPGLSAPPSEDDARHGASGVYSGPKGLAVEPSTGRLYVPANGGQAGIGVYVLDNSSPTPPTGTLDSLSGKTSHSVIAHATIDPNGPPDTSYHFEYSQDGVNWTSLPSVLLGSEETPQSIEETIDPLPYGLEPNTEYHLRLAFKRRFGLATTTAALSFSTDPAGPIAETVGSPLRSDTTAQLEGRVAPRNSPTTYHFEYGTEGPCASGPCTTTADRPAGSGAVLELVSEPLEELQPNTTYHYRLVAENGVGPAVAGEDMTLTTPATEAPLSHGHFPGPPGNDRAWEMVSLPNSGGNPVNSRVSIFSDDGERFVYGVEGGTPIAETGSPAGQYFSQRTASGWQTQLITPPREQLIGPDWDFTSGSEDLTSLVSVNSKFGDLRKSIWRYGPGGQPEKLQEALPPQAFDGLLLASEDTTTVATVIQGGALDPAYPTAAAKKNFYELGSGAPQLISLLPGDAVAGCGVRDNQANTFGFVRPPQAHMLSEDGRFLFFPSQGDGPCFNGSRIPSEAPTQLYARDLVAEETKAISAPSLSGPQCGAAFIRSTPGAVFFWSQARLAAEDSAPASCTVEGEPSDGDVYRYDLGDGSLDCVTCAIAGFGVDVLVDPGNGEDAADKIGVSEDGSQVYFRSADSLLPGTPPGGAYRVEVASGALAYLGPVGDLSLGGFRVQMNPDGSVLSFASKSTELNPLGGASDNGATEQVYRYDDSDGSLVCISCPANGSEPRGRAGVSFLDDAGDTLVFATPTSLVSTDQNTAASTQSDLLGTDIYEWRDGRLLLITDGLTNWPQSPAVPAALGITPSGRDVFFSAYAQYTPDALDTYRRVYDARLGGGFEYPKPPPPCPLEVCQGTPKGSPEERAPGTGTFAGPGNLAEGAPASCHKPKVRRKGRCVARKPKARHHKRHQRAKHDGRASR
jgi:hypothetical protein